MATKRPVTEAELRELYLEQQLNQIEIGEIFGCDRKNIDYYLKKYGIPKRSHKEAHILRAGKQTSKKALHLDDITVEAVRELLEKGMTVSEIADHFGVVMKTIKTRVDRGQLQELVLKNQSARQSEMMKKRNPIPKGSKRDKAEMKGSIEARKRYARESWWKIKTFGAYAKVARAIAYSHYGKGEKVPEGMVIDHIFSVLDGWKKGIYVEDISHPNNLRLVLQTWNLQKTFHSHMTLEEFKKIVPGVRFFRDELKKVCPGCNKEFDFSTAGQKYCGRECADKMRFIHVERACEVCDQTFVITHHNQMKRKTCSDECSLKLRSINSGMRLKKLNRQS